MPKVIEIASLPSTASVLWQGVKTLNKKAKNNWQLPEITIRHSDTSIGAHQLAAYRRICGFSNRQIVPLTFVHQMVFPLHLELMAHPSFPFPMVGMVHLSNYIKQFSAVTLDDVIRIEVACGEVEQHEKGLVVVLESKVWTQHQLAWQSSSKYLHKYKLDNARQLTPWPFLAINYRQLVRTQSWVLDASLGNRFAKVSGDYNPIHISNLGAKLFGFPSKIAHGMWTLGRSLAALQNNTAVQQAELSVEFKQPILLPATVEFFKQGTSALSSEFEVRRKGSQLSHLSGVFSVTQ